MKRTPLVRRTPLRSYARLRPRAIGKKRPPAETRYRAWIRTLPCAICSQLGVEAAHTNVLGGRGLSQKSSNRSVIPLCTWCHRLADDSYHQLTPESRWADYHGLDLVYLVQRLHHCWELIHPPKEIAA